MPYTISTTKFCGCSEFTDNSIVTMSLSTSCPTTTKPPPRSFPVPKGTTFSIKQRRRNTRLVSRCSTTPDNNHLTNDDVTQGWDKASDGPQFAELDLSSTGGLGGTSENSFGPMGVLLIGFVKHEVELFKEMMENMDASFVPLQFCTEDMLEWSLERAFGEELTDYVDPPLGLKRAVVMSGMYATEVVTIIDAYKEVGLPYCVFAAAVPKNWNHAVNELVDEIYDDDAMMRERNKG